MLASLQNIRKILPADHGKAVILVNGETHPMQGSRIVGVHSELPLFGRGAIRTDEDVPGLRLGSEVHFAAPPSGPLGPRLEIQTADQRMDRIRDHPPAARKPAA